MTLGRQILVALAFTLVSSIIVYGICLIVPKTYESNQVLFFPSGGTSPTNLAAQFFNGGSNQGSDQSLYGLPGAISSPLVGSSSLTAMGIMESRSCLDYVVNKLDLTHRWRTTPSKARDQLQHQGKVKTDDNGFVVITGQADDPKLARDIAKTMYDYLDSASVELTISIAKRNRKALEDRLTVSKANVEKARDQLVYTAVRHPFVDTSSVQSLLADSLKKVGDAKAALASAETKISSLEIMIQEATSKLGDAGALQAMGGGTLDRSLEALVQDMKKHQTDLEMAKRTYTEKSPEFKAAALAVQADHKVVEQTIGEARSSLKTRSFPPLIQARSELESLRKAADTYDQILAQYKQMALKVPTDATLVKLMQSQFDVAVKISESLSFQLEQAIINEERDPARSEVIDEAVVEPDPVAPRKGFITGGWAAACIAFSCWWIARRKIRFVD